LDYADLNVKQEELCMQSAIKKNKNKLWCA